MVNYYDLLGVSQDADRATIEQAIKKTRRLWNNRANNPDASIRAEAEQHVRAIPKTTLWTMRPMIIATGKMNISGHTIRI